MRAIHIPPTTQSQKEILYQLYKFRYLLIRQLLPIFNHNDSKQMREWIQDLQKKRYINIIKDETNPTKPYIICLAQKARWILMYEEGVNQSFLNRLYKEKSNSENYISRMLFVADCYVFFLRTLEKGSELNFFTHQDLKEYNYLPLKLIDAYIDINNGKSHSRYFLYFFNYTADKKFVPARINDYFEYCDSKKWQKNTSNEPFPSILLLFEHEIRRRQAYYLANAKLKKRILRDINIYVAMKNSVSFPKEDERVWLDAQNDELDQKKPQTAHKSRLRF